MNSLKKADSSWRVAQIGLVGAGPVGGLLATCLAENGHSFYWAERNAKRRNWIVDFAIRHPDITVTAVESAGQFKQLRWVILAVKAHEVAPALNDVSARNLSQTLIVANGLVEGGGYLGLLYGGARLAGELVIADKNRMLVGPVQGENDASEELVELLDSSYLSVEHCLAMRARQWHKLAMNCVVNPLTVIHDCLNGELLDQLESPTIQQLLAELHAVAAAELGADWTHTPEQLQTDLAELITATARNSSSMREDHRNGRTTEISHLNLAVVRLGLKHGLACPMNEKIGRMVSS